MSDTITIPKWEYAELLLIKENAEYLLGDMSQDAAHIEAKMRKLCKLKESKWKKEKWIKGQLMIIQRMQ